jgi:hypothetical protein
MSNTVSQLPHLLKKAQPFALAFEGQAIEEMRTANKHRYLVAQFCT